MKRASNALKYSMCNRALAWIGWPSSLILLAWQPLPGAASGSQSDDAEPAQRRPARKVLRRGNFLEEDDSDEDDSRDVTEVCIYMPTLGPLVSVAMGGLCWFVAMQNYCRIGLSHVCSPEMDSTPSFFLTVVLVLVRSRLARLNIPADWMFRPSQTVPHGKRAPVSDDDDDVTEASAQAAKKPRVIGSDSEDEVCIPLPNATTVRTSRKA
jgi:hypothetical protein